MPITLKSAFPAEFHKFKNTKNLKIMFARLHHELEASFSKAALGKPECKDGLAVLVYFFIKFFASGCSEL